MSSVALWFLIDGSMRIAGYSAFGFMNAEALTALLMALPVAIVGLLIGGRIHTRMSTQTFKRVISVLLVLSGLALLLK